MTSHTGQKYLCHIPSEINTTESEKQESDSYGEDTSHQIMEHVLAKFVNSCYYRISGWWIYEFCFPKHVRQFHQEENVVTVEYFLGYSQKSNSAVTFSEFPSVHVPQFTIVKNPLSPTESYVTFTFTNGTICDLTGHPRETEVRMYCSPPSDLTTTVTAVDETSTCKYLVKFQSESLCAHKDFKAQVMPTNSVNCYAIEDGVSREPSSNQEDAAAASAPPSTHSVDTESSTLLRDEL